jgi:uncharacterized protein
VDAAHLLPEPIAKTLSDDLAAHEARTGNQVAVLTLPSLEGEPLEEFSHRVATTWKLGQKGADNGVLILVVTGDRKIRIEVGYGLEGTLTDAKSAHIIREEMAPRFKGGAYAAGILAGVKAVLGTIEGTYSPPERPRRSQSRQSDGLFTTGEWVILALAVVIGIVAGAHIGPKKTGTVIGDIAGSVIAFLIGLTAGWAVALVAGFIVLFLAFYLWTNFSGTPGIGGSGGFSGSGGFGGGFSGGGGSFGGGGASGDW